MEKPNVSQFPAPRRQPANDTRPGALAFGIPKDVLDDATARQRAGLNTICQDRARPIPFEAVMVTLPDFPLPRPAMTLCAPPDRKTALIRFTDQAPQSIWVQLTQITYPTRNEHCGVA